MAEDSVVFAYLEAGKKSTAVALDPRLTTGKPDTVWLFNLARGEFVEYRRDIVETKMRDFRPEEQALYEELKDAFTKARRHFQPKTTPRIDVPEQPAAPAAAAAEAETAEALPAEDPEAAVTELDEELLDLDPDLQSVEDLDEELD